MNDKNTHSFARPAKENIRQGEGRHVLRFPIRKRQDFCGDDGVGTGFTTPCGCSVAVGLNNLFRKSFRRDRSHKLWDEANRKAQCGKSARWV